MRKDTYSQASISEEFGAPGLQDQLFLPSHLPTWQGVQGPYTLIVGRTGGVVAWRRGMLESGGGSAQFGVLSFSDFLYVEWRVAAEYLTEDLFFVIQFQPISLGFIQGFLKLSLFLIQQVLQKRNLFDIFFSAGPFLYQSLHFFESAFVQAHILVSFHFDFCIEIVLPLTTCSNLQHSSSFSFSISYNCREKSPIMAALSRYQFSCYCFIRVYASKRTVQSYFSFIYSQCSCLRMAALS